MNYFLNQHNLLKIKNSFLERFHKFKKFPTDHKIDHGYPQLLLLEMEHLAYWLLLKGFLLLFLKDVQFGLY